MVVSLERFEQLVLADPERRWELHDGRLREKPAMTFAHNRVALLFGAQLIRQLDLNRFDLRLNSGHVFRPETSYYVPDILVVPFERALPKRPSEDAFEVYRGPVLLVIEVWSPSTGGDDVATKLPEYRGRGDLEIWRVHPYERTVIAWRRQADGSYLETMHQGGTLEPIALPGVTIDLDAIFEG